MFYCLTQLLLQHAHAYVCMSICEHAFSSNIFLAYILLLINLLIWQLHYLLVNVFSPSHTSFIDSENEKNKSCCTQSIVRCQLYTKATTIVGIIAFGTHLPICLLFGQHMVDTAMSCRPIVHFKDTLACVRAPTTIT